MMRRLYTKIAFRVAMALVASIVAAILVIFILDTEIRRNTLAHLLPSHGLAWVQAELLRGSPEQQKDMLENLRPYFRFPMQVVDRPDLSTTKRYDTDTGTVYLEEPTPLGVFIYLPLKDDQHLLAGPIHPPRPPKFMLWLLPIFALTLTMLSAFTVVYPLARDVRRLQKGMARIGNGALEVQLESHRSDDLAELTHSVNHMAQRLSQLFRAREELLQAVSHEIGTPLARMRFHLEMLTKAVGRQDAETQKRLDALDDELEEIDQLGTDLVGWVEADAAQLDRKTFAVGPMLENLAELESQDAAGHPGVTVQVNVPEGLTVNAEPRHFQKALENLIRNAARYAKNQVVVEARKDADLTIEVRDDGPGIPENDRKLVLEPFTRREASRNRKDGGMGLGLAIVHRVVQRHGGQLRIDTAPEGGALVMTSWPTRGI